MKHAKITLIAVLAVLLFSGCKDFWHPEGAKQDTSGNNNNGNTSGNPFVGVWSGTLNGKSLIITFHQNLEVYMYSYDEWGDGASHCQYSGGSTVVDMIGFGSSFDSAQGVIRSATQMKITFYYRDSPSDTITMTKIASGPVNG